MKKLFAFAVVAILSIPVVASAAGRPHFEIFTGAANAAGQTVYFRLIAGNGEKVLASEAYANKQGAMVGIASILRTGVGTAKVAQSQDGKWFFVIRGWNFKVTGVSETYVKRGNAVRAIHDVHTILNQIKYYKIAVKGA